MPSTPRRPAGSLQPAVWPVPSRRARSARCAGPLCSASSSIAGSAAPQRRATWERCTVYVRLGQACVRVADLSFTRRSSLQFSAADEVEEILADAELPFVSNASLQGRHGNIVVVDFLVEGRRRKSAVLTLAAQSATTAHTTANEVFRKHYDLDTPQRGEQRVTIFDDRLDVYRPEDIDRLRDVCEVVPLSARQDVVALLAA